MFYCLMLLLFSSAIYSFEPFQIQVYVDPVPTNIECYMGVDIGGTKSNFGFFDLEENKPRLLFLLGTKTKKITKFNTVFQDVLSYAKDTYGITVKHSCIAAPGVATEKKDFARVGDKFSIKSKKLIEKSDLVSALIVNDLYVVGYGLDLIDQNNVVHLYGKKPEEYGLRGIIGNGTGIGSAMSVWNGKLYDVYPGEAGCANFAPNTQIEYELANHIKQMRCGNEVYWSNLISGTGMRRIYSMLKLKGQHNDSLRLDDHDPMVIAAHPEDELCKATIELWFSLFIRFVHNYAMTVLPYGGLYLIGGVTSKNVDYFNEHFDAKYTETANGLLNIIKRIPVYLVTDTNVNLYGAVQYLINHIHHI